MLLKSVYVDFFADSRVVIALVQTEMAYGRAQKPAAHFPGVLQRRFYQAAVMNHSQRNTLTIHMEMYLAAASAPVRRVASKALSRCFFESASGLAARCRP